MYHSFKEVYIDEENPQHEGLRVFTLRCRTFITKMKAKTQHHM